MDPTFAAALAHLSSAELIDLCARLGISLSVFGGALFFPAALVSRSPALWHALSDRRGELAAALSPARTVVVERGS